MAEKKTKKKAQGTDAQAQTLCEQLGVSRLWRNSRGEYFTERTYALSSEGGDKTKVAEYNANTFVRAPEENTEEDNGNGEGDKPKEE